ncbi:MAG: MMPL family transporter [Gemmatimonadota bacterium]
MISPRATSLAGAIVRHRRWLAAFWIIAAMALLPFARRLAPLLQTSIHIDGSQSNAVSLLLRSRFASPFARAAVIVVTGAPSPTTQDGSVALRRIVDAAKSVPGVTHTLSYLDRRDSAFLGAHGESLVLVGLDANDGAVDKLMPRLRASTTAATAALVVRYPRLSVKWTGEDALNFDLRRTSAANVSLAERRALPLTLALLVLAFGTLAASVIPLAAAALAIGLSLGAAALIASHWPLSIVLQNVVSMLGLGLGVDYSLLLITRFREARHGGLSSEAAAVVATVNAGHSVLVSAATVIVGFASLLIVPLDDLRSIAVGGLLVVAVSSLVAVTLVPGVLASLGPRVEWGRVGRSGTRRESPHWRRWALFVARRPVRVLLLAGVPLVALAAQALRLEPRLPRAHWLPHSAESARAMQDLTAMERGGIVQTMRVVIAFPKGLLATDAAGWSATQRLADVIASDTRVLHVRALPSIVPGVLPSSPAFYLVPADVRATYLSRDEQLAMIEVIPLDTVQGEALTAIARDLRNLDVARIAGIPGVTISVGGVPGLNADYADAILRRMPRVVGLVVGGILVALLIGFRSVLVPLKAVALDLLAVAAALGVVVLVFQDGYGARLLGLDSPLDGTFVAIPLLVFCVVFGLSMDYEVFLISRIAEARRRGASEGMALVSGVARSGRVITSAAAIMVIVFGAFALGEFVIVKILGVALAAAVVLDATLIRLAVGPALLTIAGRWNWWPATASGQSDRSRSLDG